MKYDLVITNGLVITEQEAAIRNIGICQGKIAAIWSSDSRDIIPEMTQKVIDAAGCYVMPGAIDTHTHFFEPGADYREDFYYGTMAAASGGFTCVLEMPNSNPAVVDERTFYIKKNLAEKKAVVDYGLWAGSTATNQDQLERLKELGCIAYKAFTLEAGPTFSYLNTEQEMESMQKIFRLNRVFGFHAEDPTVIRELRKKYESQPWTLELHDKARPYYAELAAINQIIMFSRETGCPVHICHLSIPEGAEMIKRAKEEGVNITAESCSHYFLLNVEDDGKYDTYALIQPPIRNRERMENMWKYLFDGTIDYLATDHAPYPAIDKEPENGNKWDVIGGAPSIDVAFPLMFDEAVLKRGMSAVEFSRLSSMNAAKRFGLYPRKGAIRVGADADLVILDSRRSWKVDRINSFSKTKSTKFPYQDREVHCMVMKTLVRGNVVYEQGKICQDGGYGRFQRPYENLG